MKVELHLVSEGMVIIDTEHLTVVSLTQFKKSKDVNYDSVVITFKENSVHLTVLEEYEALKTLFNMKAT